ncbi:glycosyltransferase [Porphyrobacter algicida]|uniref:Glycosyltransferase n=1 Tax=Qipengyuania algicida TaxID=1836209 RepID=A0A845AHG2_9SPHN|nr:glycosyltransferase [Qipengyuania algicida]
MSARHVVPKRILHLHGNFDRTSAARRSVDVINGLGSGFGHAIVSGDNIGGGIDSVNDDIIATRVVGFTRMGGAPTPGKLQRIARDMRGYDLVCTYGSGAMNAALAHTLFADLHGLPPLIHHEDGAEGVPYMPSRRQVWLRRIGLGRAAGLVVVNEELEELALTAWQQPIGRVKHIPDGIEPPKRRKPPKSDALSRLLKRPGELWVGNCSEFLPRNNLPMLVRAFAELADNWHLVLLGDGPDRARVEEEVDRLGINHRVHIRPAPERLEAVLGLFEIYALAGPVSSDYPPRLLSIIASGVPLAGAALGSSADFVSPDNAAFVFPEGNVEELAQSLVGLSFDERLRKSVGEANRAEIAGRLSRERMIASYKRLYSSAIDRGPTVVR